MTLISFISSAGITIALFVVFLLLLKEKRTLSDRLLAGWVIALGLNQLYFLLSGPDGINLHFLIAVIGMGMVLVHAPLFYLFVKYSFREKIRVTEWIHAIPFMLFLFVFSVVYAAAPDTMSIRNGFITFTELPYPILSYYGLFFAITAGSYTFSAYFLLRRKKKEVVQFYSNQARNVLRWLELWIIAALLFFIFTWLVVELTVLAGKIDPSLTFGIISSFLTIYIFFVGILGVRFTRLFHQPIPQPLFTGPDENHHKQHETELRKIAGNIIEVTESKKLYLNPDLSLADLADSAGVAPQKISQTLKKVIGKNFYTFINEYRARLFISRLNQPEFAHLSLLGLAYECGFGAKSTFYDFFKSYTGKPPAEYKKELMKKSG